LLEVVEDSIKNPSKTIFSFIKKDGNQAFDTFQIKSLNKVGQMIKNNGAKFIDFTQIAKILSE